MRIKTDFVTNSSSSSFVMVGIRDQEVIQNYINALMWSSPGIKIDLSNLEYGDKEMDEYEKRFNSIDNAIYEVGDLIHFFEPENNDSGYLGLELEPMLKKDMKFSEMQKEVIKTFKKHNIDVEPNQIDFYDLQHYG